MSDALFGGEVVGEVGSRLLDHDHRTGRPAAKAIWWIWNPAISPLQSRRLPAKAFVVWVEGVVGTALSLQSGRHCVRAKSGSWSSRAIEDGSAVVPVVAIGLIVVVVVGAGGGRSSNKGRYGDIEGVSGCVARELVRSRILNLMLILSGELNINININWETATIHLMAVKLRPTIQKLQQKIKSGFTSYWLGAM